MNRNYPMENEKPELTLRLAMDAFSNSLIGTDDEVMRMVMSKMEKRQPLEQRYNLVLTEKNLREVIKEIHEPAQFIKLSDWDYLLNFTGIPFGDEEMRQINGEL